MSVSVAGVLRKLGVRQSGGSHSHISKRIREYGIDTSHFTGQGSNRGEGHRGGPDRKTWSEILVKRASGYRTKSHQLRRALVECGREYKCAECGLGGVWLGRPITLQVDHLNRDWLDDSPDNLEFRCPNCHSQTDGWCGQKQKNTPP